MFKGEVPVPDRAFIRNLKVISPRLDCEFSRKHGKFVITCTGEVSGKYELFLVEGDEGGGYRYPDNRDIQSVWDADRYVKSRRQRIREGEEYMRGSQEQQDKKVAEDIRDMTKDDRRQLVNAYTKLGNLGKAESTFRKVDTRPAGQVTQHKGFIVIDKTNR